MDLRMLRKESLRGLIFAILSREYPLRLVELRHTIARRYGRPVTFQAVRKAALQLEEEGVLEKRGGAFAIRREWVLAMKQTFDRLTLELAGKRSVPRSMESAGGEVSVFTFPSLNAMMVFWQDLIENWYRGFLKGGHRVNVYQAAHAWEGLLHLDREKQLMGRLRRKGIASTIVSTGVMPLDRNIGKFYASLGVRFRFAPSRSSVDRGHYVGTYGDLIVQCQYPPAAVHALEGFFRRNRSLDALNLKELSDIAHRRLEVKLTVIKNLSLAKQINQAILSLVE